MTEESSIPENDYWSEARRPLSCLTFLIPWILVYEAGVLFVAGTDADAVRNGADFWLRSLLSGFGLQQSRQRTLKAPFLIQAMTFNML